MTTIDMRAREKVVLQSSTRSAVHKSDGEKKAQVGHLGHGMKIDRSKTQNVGYDIILRRVGGSGSITK